MGAVLGRLVLILGLLTFALSAQAAAVTLGAQTASTANVATYNSGAFTPAVGDLLVAFCGVTGQTATDWAVTDDQTGTWVKIRREVKAASADIFEIWVRKQLVASAVSHTVTYSHVTGNATGGVVLVWRVSGMTFTAGNAVRQSAGQSNQAASTTPAPVFAAAALTGNPTLTAVFNATNTSGVTAPTGWTPETDQGYNTPATGSRGARRDSGFTGTTITWGSTSASAFAVIAVELDTSTTTGTPTYVQWRTSPLQNNVASDFQKMRLPNPSPGGNLLLCVCEWSSSGSANNPTLSDDKTNTWNLAAAVDDTTNTEKGALFYAMNVTSGTSLVTATWSPTVGNNMCWLSEVRNVATVGALDGAASANPTASTAPASGSFNTTADGDLIVHYVFDTTGHNQAFTVGTGMTKRQVNDWSGGALQYQIQSTAGATNPSFTAGTSSRWTSITAAFKPAVAGADLASGIRVRGMTVLVAPMFGTLATSMPFEVPTFSGNLLAVNWVDEDLNNSPTITSSPANTFTNVSCAKVTATSTMDMRWVYVVAPSTSSDMTITFAYATAPALAVVNAVYEISGAHSSAPFDTCANASGNLAATSGTVTGPNLTPSTANGLVLAAIQQAGDTVTAVPSPVGANRDNGDWGIYTLLTADQDGGYMNYSNPDTSAVQVNWTYSGYQTPPTNVGNWGSQAVAFKAPSAGGAPSNLPLMACCTAFSEGSF